MIYLIVRLKRSANWWKATLHRNGETSTFAFVRELLMDWLRSLTK